MRLGEIFCKLLTVIFLVSILYGFDDAAVVHLTLIASFVHECGHISAARITRCAASLPSGRLLGLKIKIDKSASYKQQLAVLLGGPLANIAASLLSFLVFGIHSEYMRLFSVLNMTTALSNLMPLDGFDGYRLLMLAAESHNSDALLRITDFLSYIFSAAATVISLYFLYRLDTGYWFFALFFTLFISKTVKFSKNSNF
ncbi:MAG: hypothetical protein IJX38_01375 [Clostridia bacterium]|nr:hypothetical protein [Clostridia bacterium]